MKEKQRCDAGGAGEVVGGGGGSCGRQAAAEVRERGLCCSIAIALRFGMLPEGAPLAGEGVEIEAAVGGERAEQHHGLVAVVGEIASLLSRVV